MDTEEKKFLDLDMVAEKIGHPGDRDMFREAVKCYHIGSHRAAVILVWIAAADCLKRRIDELATEGDPVAQTARTALQALEGQAVYESNLIECGKECDLFDEYEERCLKFARDTRSKSAHPSGVVPTAEAVRHILQICTQVVLCRKGYRGIAFIRSTVTTQFDNPFFLPHEENPRDRCANLIDRVPSRLWGQFSSIAATERPTATPGTWYSNAIHFFGALLEKATDDATALEIAKGMSGFEASARDFFATLVGLDPRVAKFWDRQKRDESRARLANSALSMVNAELVRSWANICMEDGFEPPDLEMLTKRIGILSRFFPDSFLQVRRAELYGLLGGMTSTDATAEQAAVALRNLFPSVLADETTADTEGIVRQVIERFVRSEKFRTVVEKVRTWKNGLLVTFLELSEPYLLQCSEDNADDIITLFDAADEFAQRNLALLPDKLSEIVGRVLRGELQPEWRTRGSSAGETFVRRLNLLLEQHPSEFSNLNRSCSALIPDYLQVVSETEDSV